MRIAVSTDLRSALVGALLAWLEGREHEVRYLGPEEEGGEADWPVVTRAAAEAVRDDEAEEAIVCCWTGTGAALCANKVHGVRAALCSDAETARGARKWNHANVLALSLRTTSEPLLEEILEAWFDEPWSTDVWNREQIERVEALERDQGASRKR